VPRVWEEEYFADFLIRGDCPSEFTPYRGVRRLLGGWSVIVRDGRFCKQKYWDADPSKAIRYSSDQEYEEHFRHAFRKAVRVRLRADGPVASELSGGLDSSSIVCMAQEVYRSREAIDRGFTACTFTYDDAVNCDERHWSRMVIEKCGVPNEQIPVDAHWPFKGCTKGTPRWDEPTPKIVLCAQMHEMGRRLKERGIKVLLSGLG